MSQALSCYQKLEHEGGAYGCKLPAGHLGPHYTDPAPNGASLQATVVTLAQEDPDRRRGKRTRTALNRFTDTSSLEPPKRPPSASIGASKQSKSVAPIVKPSKAPRNKEEPKTTKKLLGGKIGGSFSRQHVAEAQADRPAGNIDLETCQLRRQDAGTHLAEIQAKLPPELVGCGWEVVPKGPSGITQGHYAYVYTGEGRPGKPSNGRCPYFTSAMAAKLWWTRQGDASADSSDADVDGNDGGEETDDGSGRRSSLAGGHASGGGWKHSESEDDDNGDEGDESSRPWLCSSVLPVLVEVRMREKGLQGSRFLANALQTRGQQAQVEFFVFNESEQSDELLKEWVKIKCLWPQPPLPPPYFLPYIKQGDALSLLHEDGWWDVHLASKDESSAHPYQVASVQYQSTRWVDATCLRPRWSFLGMTMGTSAHNQEEWQEKWEFRPSPTADSRFRVESPRADLPVATSELETKRGSEMKPEASLSVEMNTRTPSGRAVDVARGCAPRSSVDRPAVNVKPGHVDVKQDLTTTREELQRCRHQRDELVQLLQLYHGRIEELRSSMRTIFPLAHSLVASAGGAITMPACVEQTLPPIPTAEDSVSS